MQNEKLKMQKGKSGGRLCLFLIFIFNFELN